MQDIEGSISVSGLPSSIHTEVAILGAMLIDAMAIEDATAKLCSEDFSLDSHKRIYRAILNLLAADQAVDYITVRDELAKTRELEAVGGPAYIAFLSEGIPRNFNIESYVRIVKDKSLLRQGIAAINHGATVLSDGGEDARKSLEGHRDRINELLEENEDPDLHHVSEFFKKQPSVDAIYESMATTRGIHTGIAEFNRMTMGYQPKGLSILAARPKMGKALRCDEPILTPMGWRRNDELHIGDALASVDGEESFVDGIFPQGIRPMFTVEFSDGRTIESDGQHLWLIHCRHWDKPRVMRTTELQRLLRSVRYQKRVWIDTFSGDFGCARSLPLHPYAMGALIGDGNFTTTTPRFSTKDPEILARLASCLPVGMQINHAGRCDYRLVDPGKLGNRVSAVISTFGLSKVHSQDRFLPLAYLESDRFQRTELLCGLMDTDGWVEKGGSLLYSTSSLRLAQDVQYLARSLGATSSIRTRLAPTYMHNGERRFGLQTYRVSITHPEAADFVHLQRKKSRVGRILKMPRLTVTSVTPTAAAECQCISVTHPSKLYVASKGFVVTHNTAKMVADAYYAAVVERKITAIFTLEQDESDIMRRMLSGASRVPYADIKGGNLSRAQRDALLDAQERIMDAPLYITDQYGMTASRIRAKCARLKRDAKGLDIAFIDQLSRLKSGDVYRKGMQVREIIGEQTNLFKLTAQELDVAMVLLCQLRRFDGKGEARPTLDHLKDSGDIEEDADLVQILHRPRYYNRVSTELDEVIVAAQREGETGTIECSYNGAIMLWEESTSVPQQSSFDGRYENAY